ncbi:winged helix-turn-helix domain-containing protein [Sphingopyxis flava]
MPQLLIQFVALQNLSRQKTRPSHPKGDAAAQAAFKKSAADGARDAGG